MRRPVGFSFSLKYKKKNSAHKPKKKKAHKIKAEKKTPSAEGIIFSLRLRKA